MKYRVKYSRFSDSYLVQRKSWRWVTVGRSYFPDIALRMIDSYKAAEQVGVDIA